MIQWNLKGKNVRILKKDWYCSAFLSSDLIIGQQMTYVTTQEVYKTTPIKSIAKIGPNSYKVKTKNSTYILTLMEPIKNWTSKIGESSV